MAGPLSGLKIIECVGIGPGPFAGMMLADMGADVTAVNRLGTHDLLKIDINRRGKRAIDLDLKNPEGRAIFLKLCKQADAVFEGYRPGVMERMNLGPDDILKINPKIIYGRMTGWGQTGPRANDAGHDLNYIAMTGALQAMGTKGAPPPVPLNLIGDYGGGGMMLAFGIVCGIIEAQKSGMGQEIDVSMFEGTNSLMSLFYSLNASGLWSNTRQENFLDGGAHFYTTYETLDGKYIALAAIEPPFMMEFITLMGLDPNWITHHMDRSKWPVLKHELSLLFKTRTQTDWSELFKNTDACVTPVLDLNEAPTSDHATARNSFIKLDGVIQPAPTPRFSRTPGSIEKGVAARRADTEALLLELGLSKDDISDLKSRQIVG